jgi:hypothetical protein
MFIPFTSLPDSSRVWIYQSDRILSLTEEKILSDMLKAFTEQWTVHGESMETSFEIRYGRYLILAANDQTSGCSIDSSVRAVKQAGEKAGVDFFNRNLISFLVSDNVNSIPLNNLAAAYAQGEWNESTLTFNNLIDTKGQLEKEWIIPAGSSWLKRYLPQSTVTG